MGVENKATQSFRKNYNFNNDWQFKRLGSTPVIPHSLDKEDWETVTLPHTVRLEPKEWKDSPSFQGISWYSKTFLIDLAYKRKKIYVKFEGAMMNADIWVNEQHLFSHKGGYLPFTVDLTDVIRFGEKNSIHVRIDSQEDWETPPGKPQNELDFVYFGGLYRNVHLIIVDPLHITDEILTNKVAGGGLFVTYPEVNDQQAVVRIQSHVINEYDEAKEVYVETLIIDSETNVPVATGKSEYKKLSAGQDATFIQEIKIDDPKLWSMDAPNLYQGVVNIWSENCKNDSTSVQIGIRRIDFTADQGFFINGERTLLNGVNHHEDFLYVGNAVSESMLYRDVQMIKEAGFNFIRAGHYPHHPAFMRACDELGVAVIIPTPGWQYYTEEGEFHQRSIQMTREMVRTFRNHSSVVCWEPVLNETWYPEEFAKEAYEAIHEEYPTDQAFAAADFGLPYGEYFDVVYKEAYSETKPLITREWGDANHHLQDGERSARKFGVVSLRQSSVHRQNSLKGNKWQDETEEDGYWDWAGLKANKRISGYALWSFNDYNRGMSREIAYSGIVDRDRYPKFNYYWFQSQQSPLMNGEPMVFIADDWQKTSPKNVHIYTNTEEVQLYVNDRFIGTKKHPPVSHIQSPIIIYEDILWEKGEVKAKGLINGQVVATHNVSTPGSPHHLMIEWSTFGIEEMIADGSDMIMAYVYVKDKNGTIVPTNEENISLHLSGPGILVGHGDNRTKANPVQTEAGIAPALIRSTFTPGELILSATALGLHSSQVVIQSIPYQGEFVPCLKRMRYELGNFNPLFCKKMISTSSNHPEHKGDYVINDHEESFWLPDEADEAPWLIIDLQENYNITGLQIHWTLKNDRQKYVIDTSEDQDHWIHMYSSQRKTDPQLEQFASHARYIRIRFLGEAPYEGIKQVEIYGSKTFEQSDIIVKKGTNLVKGKKAIASSFAEGNEPEKAINQQLTSSWQAKTYDLPQWLQVDLGVMQSISGAKILWGKDSTHYTYKIQVSMNEEEWLDVINQTTTGSHYHPINFNKVTARYLRVYVEDLMAGGGSERVAIKELEIYKS